MAVLAYQPKIIWQEYQSVADPVMKSPWDALKEFPLPQPIISWEATLLSNLIIHNIPHSDVSVLTGGSRKNYEIAIEGWIYPAEAASNPAAERQSLLKQLAALKEGLRGNPSPEKGLPGFFTLQRWKKKGGVEEVYYRCKTKRFQHRETSTPLYRIWWSAVIIAGDASK